MTQAKAFGAAMGLAIGGATVAAGVKEIISIGNDYTVTMNTLQAVSGATAEQLAAAGQRAKELGNDIQLPGTSANDAAAAMTELAKGGFSVQESMDAAKGTLQMAAAAQIDAASAATIQSQALQSFGLNADYAAKVSDVLANAANASSAEITDVASGLQQSGAVANQFGLSIEDTAATLGLLANAGIQGSDAGTLLKSTLLALTDQSNPAQGAIEELGLTVYNAQGQFVGMSELFGQLDAAAASMSPELYQAATATLFGSDAMRLAGVAAEQGREGYDSMRDAVDRQGAAAEVAAAKVQGLPGAMASVQNSAETLALGIYDLVDGPLEGLATKGADFVTNVTPGIIDGFSTIGSTLAPVASLVGDVASAFGDLPGPVQAVAVALAAVKVTGIDDTIGETISGWRDSISEFREELAGEVEMQAALAGISDADTANPFAGLTEDASELTGAIEENAEPISELAAGLATLERRSPAIRNMAEGYRGVTDRTREFANQQRAAAGNSGVLGSALRNATARASEFGGVVGGAAVAGMRGLKSAASGVIGALGGPWMLGIMAATAAVGGIISENAKATRQQDLLADSSSKLAVAQRDVAKAFQESQGEMSDTAMSAISASIGTVRADLQGLADTAPGFWAPFAALGKDIAAPFQGEWWTGTEQYDSLEQTAEAAKRTKDAFDSLNMSDADLAAAVSGTDLEFAQLTSQLRSSVDGGVEAAAKLREVREGIEQARQVAKNTTPGFYDLQVAVATLSDESATAGERIDAMRVALDVLAGKPIPLSDALQKYNDQVRATADAAAGWDPAGGIGDALIGEGGTVNTATANGSRLRDVLLNIKDATLGVAESGGDLTQVWAQNDSQLQQLSQSTGVSVDALRRMLETEALIPKNVEMLAALKGADTVEQQLQIIRGLLDQNAEGVEIPTKALTADAKRELEIVGAKVEEVDGKPGVVKISAPNAEVLAQIQAVIDRNIPDKTVGVNVVVNNPGEVDRRVNDAIRAGIAVPGQTFAEGGAQIPNGALSGPGTTTSDSMLMYSPGYGYWRGSTGEHVLDAGDVQAMGGQDAVYRFREMLHSNKSSGPMVGLPGFAEGGALDRVRDVGRRANGNPYVWGGAEVSGADCSGFVAILQRAAMGQGESGRLGTTYSLLAGEWPGLVPGTQGPFVVGTSEEHMAATIGGVNYESGGANNGITVGGSAAGAFDSQFGSQYYLPWELFAPPYDPASGGAAVGMSGLDSASTYTTSGGYSSKRKATWAEKDDLALESARIAITQAEEDLQAALGNPKKSEADKDQARIKVEKAKQKVKDLEAKKDAAAKGLDAPPAPDAPELTTNYSDEQLSALDAEAAVVDANLKRNEVYADPESTDEDKRAADRALQRAKNALAKDKSGSSSSSSTGAYTADQWSSVAGDLAKSFVSETFADVLGYYEADNMGPLAKAAVAFGMGALDLQKQHLEDNAKLLDNAKPGTPNEIAGQLPTTPGTPDWIELLRKGLIPTPKLFDNGGVWKSGTFGLNMSGQDEEVLTGSMRRSVAQELALSRAARLAPAASVSERREARPITVNNNGYDRREVAAGIRQARQEDEWFSRATRIGES
ncbi:phage tail tape measure protein [Rhodococcus sp. 114MFTsu3.1]|uniref:phage tail tape measure protein n=1 Tax=Rhodococcus sp. 114MFTsu3.1 TaxID=1172184 RepID=UPI001E57FE30|nr:phage tail tape measure protein [Rhodococcus sp. 114MFTsu3.1]